MKRGRLIVVLLILFLFCSFVYAACTSSSNYQCPPYDTECGGVQIIGYCYDCGYNTDDICPEDYGAICLEKDLDCCKGDGFLNSLEDCDGSNLNDETCQTLGFGSGTLSCSSSCEFDTSGCSEAPPCNNDGVKDTYEECDILAFGTYDGTCVDYNSALYESGDLICDNCVIKTTNCILIPGTAEDCYEYLTLGECNGNTAGTDTCYWGKILKLLPIPSFIDACTECDSGTKCSDYYDKTTCGEDPCSVTGTCYWDTDSKCKTSYTAGDLGDDYYGPTDIPGCDCTGVTYSEECVDKKMKLVNDCTWDGTEDTRPAECHAPAEKLCAKPEKFPVFTGLNIFIVILMLIAYYLYVMKRRKK